MFEKGEIGGVISAAGNQFCLLLQCTHKIFLLIKKIKSYLGSLNYLIKIY
jgi:hypothetical protein